jgi:hypothetical protein
MRWAIYYTAIFTLTLCTVFYLCGKVSMADDLKKRDQELASYQADFLTAIVMANDKPQTKR